MPFGCCLSQLMFRVTIRQIHRSILANQHVQESLRGAAVALVLMIIGLGFGLGFNVILARRLGAAGVGLYTLSFDTVSLAAMLATFGLNKTILRTTAANSGLAQWGTVWGAYDKSVSIVLAVSAVFTIALVMVAPILALYVFKESDLITPLRLISLAVIPASLLSLHIGALKGLKKIRDSIFLEKVGVPFIGLLALIFLGQYIGVNEAVVVYVTAVFALLAYGVWIWRKSIPASREVKKETPATHSLLSLALPFFIIDFTNLIAGKSGSMFLGIWASSEDVGIYNVALRVAILVSIVLVAANSILSSKFASLYAQQDMQSLANLARSSTRMMFLIALFIAMPLLLFPEVILGLFGPDFIVGAPILRILLVGQLVNVAVGPVGTLLLMTRYENAQKNNVLFTSLLNIVLGLLFVPRLGVTGAAIAFSVTLIVMNVTATLLVRIYLGINIWAVRT